VNAKLSSFNCFQWLILNYLMEKCLLTIIGQTTLKGQARAFKLPFTIFAD